MYEVQLKIPKVTSTTLSYDARPAISACICHCDTNTSTHSLRKMYKLKLKIYNTVIFRYQKKFTFRHE